MKICAFVSELEKGERAQTLFCMILTVAIYLLIVHLISLLALPSLFGSARAARKRLARVSVELCG